MSTSGIGNLISCDIHDLYLISSPSNHLYLDNTLDHTEGPRDEDYYTEGPLQDSTEGPLQDSTEGPLDY